MTNELFPQFIKMTNELKIISSDTINRDIINMLFNDTLLKCIFPEYFTNDNIIMTLKYIQKDVYSEFLCRKRHSELLKLFICSIDYKNVPLVKAMRKLFSSLILPKESQSITFILETFGEHFNNCNMLSDIGYNNTIIFQLICSILMLNTDLHNINVSRKISMNKFINNWYKNIDTLKFIEKDILKGIYEEILNKEFLL